MQEVDRTSEVALDKKDVSLLEQAARDAGSLALKYFGKDPETWFKGAKGKSPVSEADLAIDRQLHQVLRDVRPHYGWLSEETADDKERIDCKRVFIVDPIDGTRAFLEGGDEWCISIAVVENGRPAVGVVFCPLRKEMFLAHRSGGAYLNGQRISVSTKTVVKGARLSGSRSLLKNPAFQAVGFRSTTPLRSLAYRIVSVAAGNADVGASHGGASDWDLAAADLLLQEAGGELAYLSGRGVTYNRVKTGHSALVAAPKKLIVPAAKALRSAMGS